MSSRISRARSAAAACLTALVGLFALFAAPRAGEAAWDGKQTLRLGDLISAEFVAPPLIEEHRYAFYVMKDAVMNTSITVDAKTKSLVPEVTLFTANDVQVDLGTTQTGNKIKNFKFPSQGDYYLRVRATAGTGIYKLDTKSKTPPKIVGKTTTGTFAFDAGAAVVCSASVKKSAGSTAKPVITGLSYNGGPIDIGTAVGKTKFSKITLPANATYTIAIDPVTAGQSVDVTVNFTFPKRRTWNFGYVEATEGQANQNREKWLVSPHSDHTAPAFTNWDTKVPPEIPENCAKCHSSPGYRDFIGADGSDPDVVDKPAPIGTVVDCDACHNDQANTMTSVTFPSGLTVSGLGNEARCIVCHQGRESTVSVEDAIELATRDYKVTNDEAAGKGVLGADVSIPAGVVFTDAGAGFVTAGVGADGTYWLQVVGNATRLSGTGGVVSTKNFNRVRIVAASEDSLTLETALVAETPAAGKSFQYAVFQLKSDDTISPELYEPLGFINIHYYAAGASLYGREAAGAYEYALPGGDAQDAVLAPVTQRRPYDDKMPHVASMDTCIECHDAHSQQVRVSECAGCHVTALGDPVASYADLRDIRMAGTVNDFDGDGNATEGIWHEIKGLEAILYAAIQDYALKVCESPIAYDGKNFVIAGTTTKYVNWTARLLRAAYDYQYELKDPGAFAHNGKFVVSFLYDAIHDLNDKLSTLEPPSPVPNFDKLKRNDPGHFDSSGEPYRHWDEDTDHLVDPSCARCHSIEGFQFVVKYGIDQTVPAPVVMGLSCETCHVEGTSFAPPAHNPNPDGMPARLYVGKVVFPHPTTATSTQISNVTITNAPQGSPDQDDSYMCMTCHRARESKLTLDAADPTGATTTFTLSFKNSHYLAAGASLYGSKAAVWYQYPSLAYSQRYDHDQHYMQPYPAAGWYRGQCKFCHMQEGDHSFDAAVTPTCTYCHVDSTSADDLTPAFRGEDNYDGDPATKPKAEYGVFQARLLAAIQAYCATATDNGVTGAKYVVYNPDAYPYFAVDTNKNGVWDPGETTAPKFDTKTFRASFNYNLSVKEPGGWAHNPRYVFQVLYDAIKDLNGNLTNLVRPPTTVE